VDIDHPLPDNIQTPDKHKRGTPDKQGASSLYWYGPVFDTWVVALIILGLLRGQKPIVVVPWFTLAVIFGILAVITGWLWDRRVAARQRKTRSVTPGAIPTP
jgi:hypothetical protein